MEDTKAILDRVLGRDYQRGVLVTLVKVEGSSYRQPGARFFVTDRGETFGAISGGCLETAVREHALQSMADAVPHLFVIDTLSAGDELFGHRLGCPGRLHLLIEPFASSDIPSSLQQIAGLLSRRQTAEVFTFLGDEMPIGSRLVVAGSAGLREMDSQRVFRETIEPPIRLVVFGAGNDAMPLVEIAAALGWEPIVVDPREVYATADRFPKAAQRIRAHPDELPPSLIFDRRTVVVVMTHVYPLDLAYVRAAITTAVAYVAIVGSRKRFEALVAELSPEPRHLHKLHGPAGLDIGSETPAEIALAILSEARSRLAGASGISLRELLADSSKNSAIG